MSFCEISVNFFFKFTWFFWKFQLEFLWSFRRIFLNFLFLLENSSWSFCRISVNYYKFSYFYRKFQLDFLQNFPWIFFKFSYSSLKFQDFPEGFQEIYRVSVEFTVGIFAENAHKFHRNSSLSFWGKYKNLEDSTEVLRNL